MRRESAVTLEVCKHILAQIAVTKAPVSEVELPAALYNMVLIERDEDSGSHGLVAGVAVSRRP